MSGWSGSPGTRADDLIDFHVPLRIAFDLDGVLADMDSALAREAEALFGEQPARGAAPESPTPDAARSTEAPDANAEPQPPATRLRLTARQQARLWRRVADIENFWETLDEIEPGSIARLAALAARQRWEVIFLTRRPDTAGTTPQMQTQRWLRRRGFPLPSVFVMQGSRGRVAAALALHFVVDDTPQNCLDVVAESKARAILVWRDDKTAGLPAAARRLGIGVVSSVGDTLEMLREADAAMHTRDAGVIGKVMKMMGLK